MISSKTNKKEHIELLRLFAMFFVIFNHTEAFSAFTAYDIKSKHYWLALGLSIFCKMAVPVFFMISGALLLGRDENLTTLFKKRIAKFTIITVLTTVAYVFYKFVRYGEVHSIRDFLVYLYTGKDLSAHLWFLYAYIAFLLSLPILRAVVKGIGEKVSTYRLIFCLSISFSLLTMIDFLVSNGEIGYSTDFSPSWLFSTIFFFPVMGYYLENVAFVSKKKVVLTDVLGAIGIVATGITLTVNYYRNNSSFEGLWIEKWHNLFIALICLGVYSTFKLIQKNNCPKILSILGKSTFVVYLIHIIIKDSRPVKNFFERIQTTGCDYLLSCILYVVIVYVISYAIALIYETLKRTIISFIRK